MKTVSPPFNYTTQDGRSISVQVYIDAKLIADALAQRAWKAGTGRTTACNGGVVVEIVEVARYQTKTGRS